MKILVVSNYYYPDFVGGAEKSSQLLAEEFTKKGHDVLVFASKHATETNVNGVPVVRAELGKFDISARLDHKGTVLEKFKNKIFDVNNKAVYPQLMDAIETFKPDVVFTNNLYGLSSIVWKAVRDSKIPLVHTVRDYWIFGCRPKIFNLYHKTFYRKRSAYVNCVVAPSKSTMDVVSKNKSYFKFADHVVIHNGMNFDVSASKKQILAKIDKLKSQNPKVLNLIFAGRLGEHKGLLNLLASLNDVKVDYRLHICGDGPLKNKVLEALESNDKIIYHGNLGKEDLYKIYSECDVLIAPSLWAETFGLIIIEAMLNGCCVIGSSYGGIGEILDYTKGGLKIDPHYVKGIANSINSLDANKMVTWLQNIYETIEHYHISNVADQYLREFNKAIKGL